MKTFFLNFSKVLSIAVLLNLSACSLLSVYKIDIPQGTPLTKQQAEKVKVGMNIEQVKYLLGSPALVDNFNPRQWEYFYDFIPGTYGKRDGIPTSNKKERLTIFFSEQGIVEKINGLETIPATQYGIPSGKKS